MNSKLYDLFPRFCLFFSITFIIVLIPGPGRPAENCLISLEAVDEKLETTLSRISKISGYTIELHSKKQFGRININLSNVPLERAFSKIFDKDLNYAIVWNDIKKIISITIIENSQNLKKPDESKYEGGVNIPLNGKNIRFKQMSRTTNY